MLRMSRFWTHETRMSNLSQRPLGKARPLLLPSDTKPKDDLDNEDDGILNAFTATVNPTEGIVEEVDEEEDLVESKFEKMDEQDDIYIAYAKFYKVFEKHEKLYRLATKKLSDVELEAELFQVRTQLVRSFQKSASDRIGLGYDFSSSNIAYSNTIVFVSLVNNVESENNDVKTVLASKNIDKGKFILRAPPKLEKKETKNPRAKKSNNQKSKQKK